MFALIADIGRYPEFLPMCEALTIRGRREKGSRTLLVADMTVGYKMIRESFTSQVFLHHEDLLIDVKYIDGPFKHLENRWRFEDIDGQLACEVDFYIDYEFKNKMLSLWYSIALTGLIFAIYIFPPSVWRISCAKV